MRRPALVLFDLDGVLVHYEHPPRVKLLSERCDVSEEAVSAALFESGLERDADLGRIDTEGLLAALSEALGCPVQLDDCLAARASAMSPMPGVHELLEDLGKQVQLAILTNNGLMLRDHFDTICPSLAPFFEDRVFCSAQFGLAKPDPELFRRCLAGLDVAPADVLFFDDKPDNAKGARRAGLMAHTYRTPAGLRAHLSDHRLLEPKA